MKRPNMETKQTLEAAKFSLSIGDHMNIDIGWLIQHAETNEKNYLSAVKGRQDFRQALRDERSRSAKLLAALEEVKDAVDTDYMQSESESGEIEYWINFNQVKDIVDDAVEAYHAETNPQPEAGE